MRVLLDGLFSELIQAIGREIVSAVSTIYHGSTPSARFGRAVQMVVLVVLFAAPVAIGFALARWQWDDLSDTVRVLVWLVLGILVIADASLIVWLVRRWARLERERRF